MKFSAQEDIEAPIDDVFAMVADFERFERMALRRGADVRRVADGGPVAAGTVWETKFNIRGKPREVTIEMTERDDPALMEFQANGKGMVGITKVDLLALSRNRTRLTLSMSLSAKTLPAKLLLQSMKLGQSRIRRQFQSRLSDFAREIEDRYRHRT
ncbi:MAG: SRPBCC family protein [Ruegeria sp.]